MKMKLPHIFYFLFSIIFVQVELYAQVAGKEYDDGKEAYYNGEYKKAEKLFLKAYELRKKELGENDGETIKAVNRLAKTYGKLRENEKALQYFEKAVELSKEKYGEESEENAFCWQNIGNIYNQMYDPEKGNEAYAVALSVLEEIHGRESEEVASVLMNIGTSFHKMAEYEDAEKYYLQSFEIIKKIAPPDSESFNRIYSNMGYMYRKKGDYKKAYEYGLKALEIKLKNYEPAHPSVAKYHRNIAKALEGMNRLEEAVPYMERALEISEISLGKTHPHTSGAYGELAEIYAGLGQDEKALRLYGKAIKLQEKNHPLDHPYVIAGYFNVGRIYSENNDWDNALSYFNTALNRLLKREYRANNLIALARVEIAGCHFGKGKIEIALEHCQLGLAELSDKFEYKSGEYFSNPQILDVQDELDLLKLLQKKSAFLEEYAKMDLSEDKLRGALGTVDLTIQLIEKMRNGYHSDESKQYLNAKTYGIYEVGVRIAYELYKKTNDSDYLWEAFLISEKSKASILWRSISEGISLITSNIPLERRKEIELLKKQLGDAQSKKENARENGALGDVKDLRGEIFNLKLEYEAKLKNLENDYPHYFNIKYSASEVSKEKLTDKCRLNETILVEYFYDEGQVFIFVFDGKEMKVKNVPFQNDFFNSIRTIRDYDITDMSVKKSESNALYEKKLNELYHQLVLPIYEEIKNRDRIAIVPHGILNYLPFEMLVSELGGNDFRKHKYIVYDWSVQYAWSAALWTIENKIKPTGEIEFLGFAPEYFQMASTAVIPNNYRMNMANLTYAVSEVEMAGQYFDGEIFIKNNATKESFFQYSPESQIIHLATHAFVDEEFPLRSGIAFSNKINNGGEVLYAHEIYNMELGAEMAVMSACNTGFGKMMEGEGVMSLGRAFFHAGCESVVMSQWLANDQSTSKLMEHFYRYIAAGEPKDKALQRAKIDYLASADALTAHPYFWANMVAVGNMNPFPAEGAYPFYALGLASLGILVLLFFLSRKRSVMG